MLKDVELDRDIDAIGRVPHPARCWWPVREDGGSWQRWREDGYSLFADGGRDTAVRSRAR